MVGVARLARFLIEGVLAIIVGKKLLGVARSPAFEYAVDALIGICNVGSVFSVYRWIKQGKKPRRPTGSKAGS